MAVNYDVTMADGIFWESTNRHLKTAADAIELSRKERNIKTMRLGVRYLRLLVDAAEAQAEGDTAGLTFAIGGMWQVRSELKT